MLQGIRNNIQGVFSWTIIIIIVAVFTFMGLGSVFSRDSNIAAKVNSNPISWQFIRNIASRQESNKVNLLQLRDELIQRAVLLTDAQKAGYRVHDKQIIEFLSKQDHFKVNGNFSKERYKKVLQKANFTDKDYREEIKNALLLEQVYKGINITSFDIPKYSDQMISLLLQTRDFGYALVSKDNYLSSVEIPEKQLHDYFATHNTEFISPELVKVGYVEFTIADVLNNVPTNFADSIIEDFYNKNKEQYQTIERYKLRHIFFAGINEQARSKAWSKALVALKQLHSGSNFVDVAKDMSEDTGTNKKGGDLGWINANQETNKPLIEAARSLKIGEYSEIINSPFGVHIVQLVSHKPVELIALNNIKEEVIQDYRLEIADNKFEEQIENFSNYVYEHDNSLEKVATIYDIPYKNSSWLSKDKDDNNLSKYPEVVAAAFSNSVLEDKQCSDLLELADKHYIMLEVIDYKAAMQQQFPEVKAKISEKLIIQVAEQKAKQLGEELLNTIKNNANPRVAAEKAGLQWHQFTKFSFAQKSYANPEIISKALKLAAPAKGKLSTLGFTLANGDYAVLAVHKVILGNVADIPNDLRLAYKNNLLREESNIEYSLYVNDAIKNSNIVVY